MTTQSQIRGMGKARHRKEMPASPSFPWAGVAGAALVVVVLLVLFVH